MGSSFTSLFYSLADIFHKPLPPSLCFPGLPWIAGSPGTARQFLPPSHSSKAISQYELCGVLPDLYHRAEVPFMGNESEAVLQDAL